MTIGKNIEWIVENNGIKSHNEMTTLIENTLDMPTKYYIKVKLVVSHDDIALDVVRIISSKNGLNKYKQ